jgi:hypothetical protein
MAGADADLKLAQLETIIGQVYTNKLLATESLPGAFAGPEIRSGSLIG